MKCYLCLCS